MKVSRGREGRIARKFLVHSSSNITVQIKMESGRLSKKDHTKMVYPNGFLIRRTNSFFKKVLTNEYGIFVLRPLHNFYSGITDILKHSTFTSLRCNAVRC